MNVYLILTLFIYQATVARGSSYANDEQKNVTDVTISTSGDWAQGESLVGLLAQNPFFNDDTVSLIT
jgi:exocyst complex component 4